MTRPRRMADPENFSEPAREYASVSAPLPTPAAHGAALAHGVIVNAATLAGSNLRGIFTLLVARLLGGPALGTFSIAWAAADLLSKFGTLGLDYSVIALVATSEAAGDRASSRRLMRRALSISFAAGLAVAFAGGIGAIPVGRRLGLAPDVARSVAVMMFGIPGMVLYRVSNAVSRGLKVMHHDFYSRGLSESLGTTAAFLLALAIGVRVLAPELAAVAGTLGSGCVAFVLAGRAISSRPCVNQSDRTRQGRHGLMRLSLPIAAYDLLNIGVMRLDVVMLGLYIGRAPGVTLGTVGIYAASVEIAGGLRKVSQAFTPIFTPVIAEQLALGSSGDAESTYGYVARWMLAVLLPAVVILALSGGALLSIFGTGFARGAPWLAILGAACALNAFVGLGETILMIRHPAWNVINTAAACTIAVLLNVMLIPQLGVLGAAIGMVVPYLAQGLLRAIEIAYLLEWRWRWQPLIRPWAAALLALPVPLIIRWFGSDNFSQCLAAASYVVAYVSAWRLIGLEPVDREILRRVAGSAGLRWRRRSTPAG